MRAEIEQVGDLPDRGPVALVIGSSAGYGLAATVCRPWPVTAIRGGGHRVRTRSRSAYRDSWLVPHYRHQRPWASELGREFCFLNADAFADSTKARGCWI